MLLVKASKVLRPVTLYLDNTCLICGDHMAFYLHTSNNWEKHYVLVQRKKLSELSKCDKNTWQPRIFARLQRFFGAMVILLRNNTVDR